MGGRTRPATWGAWSGRVSQTLKTTATLRSASAADIAAVAEIERTSFGDPWSARSFADLLDWRGAIFLVATRSEAAGVAGVIGYVVAIVAADQAEILNLAVSPAERQRGVGGELLDAGLGAVRDAHARDIFLDVRESNGPALGLYASRGFSVVGRRGGYYRNPVEDALVLRRAHESE